MDRLRLQAKVAHHRNADVDEPLHDVRDRTAPFELDGGCAAFLQQAAGIADLNRKFTMADMASGDVSFAATGITDGSLLEGVRFTRAAIFTHSVVMRSVTGTVRYIESHHRFDQKPNYGW